MEWTNKVVMVIGGTGSFGSNFLPLLMEKKPRAIRIYSRDEHKQSILLNTYGGVGRGNNLSGFIGDIRDKDRLNRAMNGVDLVVHCAALKQVQSCEYNPLETIKTNIMGSMNIIDTALDNNVEKVLAISTDKAVNPLNLYGATKMCMERLMTTANAYRGTLRRTKFCATRYGNVVSSRGTIVPLWRELLRKGESIPITNVNATRFWIGMKEANKFVADCVELMDYMDGGEILVPKIPSVKVMDVYQAMTDGLSTFSVIGDRIGDKLHESLISKEEATHTVDMGDKYIIYPENPQYPYKQPKGYACGYKEGYRSDNNENFLTIPQISKTLEENL
jgi:UDP-N-acetylglucosamine 4,6-dehydratase